MIKGKPVPGSVRVAAPRAQHTQPRVGTAAWGPHAGVSVRSGAVGRSTVPSIRASFLLASSTHKLKVFSSLTKHLPLSTVATTSAVCLKCDSKTSSQFFFLLRNIINRRFVPTIDQSNVSIWPFFFLLKSRTVTFPRKGSTLMAPALLWHLQIASVATLALGGHREVRSG